MVYTGFGTPLLHCRTLVILYIMVSLNLVWGQISLPAADLSGKSRTDWTSIAAQHALGKVKLDVALKGKTFTVGVDPSNLNIDPLMLSFNKTGYPSGGHIYTSIGRIAVAMGATAKWMKLPHQGDKSEVMYVASSVQLVDVFAAFYINERDYFRPANVMPTQATLFNPSVLVTSSPPTTSLGTWNFAVPYDGNLQECVPVLTGLSHPTTHHHPPPTHLKPTPHHPGTLWALLVGTLLLHGFINRYVLKHDPDEPGKCAISFSYHCHTTLNLTVSPTTTFTHHST